MRVDQLYRKKSERKDIDPSISAEVKMVMLLVQHNIFFNVSDHLTAIIKQEFKESNAAQKFSCSRTKTAVIVNCLGDHYFDSLVKEMQELPFSIMLDASNDNGLAKMYPITVRIFDINDSRVMTKLIDMNLIEGASASTAAAMFSSVDKEFEKFQIPWEYCLAIGVDNRNANIGDHNSIKSRAIQKNSTIIMSGCVCHNLHNATCKAGSLFSNITSSEIEDYCVDLYHWFDKSSKRKNVLREYFEFCDMEYSEVIKFVSTRWLLLEFCVNRELKKYDGLKFYFLSEETREKRFQRLHEAFSNPMLEIYLLFY